MPRVVRHGAEVSMATITPTVVSGPVPAIAHGEQAQRDDPEPSRNALHTPPDQQRRGTPPTQTQRNAGQDDGRGPVSARCGRVVDRFAVGLGEVRGELLDGPRPG